MQVDALIIGGMWGKKDQGGMLGEYVLALADGKAQDSLSPFLSFCRSAGSQPSAEAFRNCTRAMASTC